MAETPIKKIKLALAENLKPELREELKKQRIESGLVALEVTVNSPPEINVVPLKKGFVDYWKQKIANDGITEKELQKRMGG